MDKRKGRYGEQNNAYKNGTGIFRNRLNKEIHLAVRYCERCGKDLVDANKWSWCVHHKDHNKHNQSPSNLEHLCKRCHQLEHNCIAALQGATTISKESTAQESGKRPAPEMGDDIVSPSWKHEES